MSKLKLGIILTVTVAILLILPLKAKEAGITGVAIIEAPVISNQHLQEVSNLDLFFAKHKCIYKNSEVYVGAAEKYNIDYRLLPALSVIEESCGLHNPVNNQFGYYMCTKYVNGKCAQMVIRPFPSIDAGVIFVASEFATNKYYKNLPLKTQLHNYNSVNPNYYGNVIKLMNEIAK